MMAEALQKYEFSSPEWMKMVRRLVEDGLRGKDISGIDFSMCEEYTDPPEHLRQPGTNSIGFTIRFADGTVELIDEPRDDVDFKLVGDYAALKEYSLRPFDPTNFDPETLAIRQRMMDEGKLRVDGRRAEWPAVLSDLDLHNEARIRTEA